MIVEGQDFLAMAEDHLHLLEVAVGFAGTAADEVGVGARLGQEEGSILVDNHNGAPAELGEKRFPVGQAVFGGESEAALRRAADLGDGWYGVGHSPASAARQAEKLRAFLAERRPGASFELTVSHGGLSLGQGDVDRYAEAGIDRVVVLPWRRGREAEVELGRLADAVLR